MIIIGINSTEQDSVIIDMLKKIIIRTNNKFSVISDLNFYPAETVKVVLNNYIKELEKIGLKKFLEVSQTAWDRMNK